MQQLRSFVCTCCYSTQASYYKDTQNWSETASACLGPGDVNRQPRARTILIMVPILLFLWELVVWSLLAHVTRNGCWLITVTLLVVSAAAIGMWYQGMRWGPVSLVSLGVLCIIAIIGGTALGQRGWEQFWRQFFWMNIGQQLVPTLGGTAAGARSDAATLVFGTEAGGLDHSSDTDLFCVAPVLSPESAGMDFPRVNYWAVGINCCSKSGNFFCDQSRDSSALQAVVQLGGGYPCPSCNVESFQKAIAKAEATYGLVSAPDALMVRWVASASKTKFQGGVLAIAYLLICVVVGSAMLFVLGWFSWYYGIGKRAPSGGVGQCMYENRLDGYPCDDGIFYTLNDTCQDGLCVGIPNYCLGYNVSCIPLSTCLVGGRCNPSTGRCTYDKLPDESPCDDGREYTVQDHLMDKWLSTVTIRLDVFACRNKLSANRFAQAIHSALAMPIVSHCVAFTEPPLTDYISRLLKCRKDPLEELAGQVAQDPAYDDDEADIQWNEGGDSQVDREKETADLRELAEHAEADAFPPDSGDLPDPRVGTFLTSAETIMHKSPLSWSPVKLHAAP
eukprot:g683.t1